MDYDESFRLLVWDKGALALIGLAFGGLLTQHFDKRSKAAERNAVALQEFSQLRRESALRIID